MDLNLRRKQLQAELAKGQELLRQHTAEVEKVKRTMLHVQGALALIDEQLAEAAEEGSG